MARKSEKGNPWQSRAVAARLGRLAAREAQRPLMRARGYWWGRRARASAPAAPVWREENPGHALADFAAGRKTGPGLWKWTHYFEPYERHLAKFVGKPVTVVEIGIYSGGSLDMWREYFGPDCHIIGVDIAAECRAYERDGITIEIGDQSDPAFWRAFLERHPVIDVVIDDGGHQTDQQVTTLEALLPRLSAGGVYACEDIAGVHNPFEDYVAGLSRSLNRWDAPDPRASRTIPRALQTMVASIHRYPYLVLIERATEPPSEFVSPRLGTDWVPF